MRRMRSKRAPYLRINDPEKHWRAYLEIDIRPFFEPIFELRISLNCAPLAHAMPLNSLLQSILLILRPPRFGLAHSQGSSVTKRRTVPHRRSVPRAPPEAPAPRCCGQDTRGLTSRPNSRIHQLTLSLPNTHTHTNALRPAAAEEFESSRPLLRLRTTVVTTPELTRASAGAPNAHSTNGGASDDGQHRNGYRREQNNQRKTDTTRRRMSDENDAIAS